MLRLTLTIDLVEAACLPGVEKVWQEGGANAVRELCEFDMSHGGYLVGELIEKATWRFSDWAKSTSNLAQEIDEEVMEAMFNAVNPHVDGDKAGVQVTCLILDIIRELNEAGFKIVRDIIA